MDDMSLPMNNIEQYNKIIKDTEEIIKNFKELSELLREKNDQQDESMFTLGKRVIHSRDVIFDPSANLGNAAVNIF